MVPKRVSYEVDNDEPESSKRRLSDLIRSRDVTLDELHSFFEPVFRKMVREVVDKLFPVSSPSPRCISNVSHDEARRDWMLRFVNQPPPKLFTGNKLEDNDGALLQIELVDVDNKAVVSAGPISSMKLEIVVLPGDYNANQPNDLGEKYFSCHIVNAREGRKPLITGKVHTSLKNGVGFIRDVCFTDNSRWTKSAKFRLGVRVMQSSSKAFRVREAVSDAFKVKDRRGEASMKHSCPSLTDEVWRLKMIRKNGKFHQRLISIGVATVGDFLEILKANPSMLKETLKCGNSNRTWNTIVEHALCHKKEQYKACKVSPKMVGSIINNSADCLPRTFPPDYNFQLVADDLEEYASNNGFNQVPVDDAPVYSSVNSEPLTQPNLPLPWLGTSDQYTDQHGHEFAPSSSNYYGMNNQMQENPMSNLALSDLPHAGNIVASHLNGISPEDFWQKVIEYESEILNQPTDHHTLGNSNIPTELPNWCPRPPLLWRQLSENFSSAISESDDGFFASFVANNATPRTAWCKLRAAVIWRILIKQIRVIRANTSHT